MDLNNCSNSLQCAALELCTNKSSIIAMYLDLSSNSPKIRFVGLYMGLPKYGSMPQNSLLLSVKCIEW